LVGEVGDQDGFADTGAKQGIQADVGGFGDVGATGELPYCGAQLQHHGVVDTGGTKPRVVDLAQCGLVRSGEFTDAAEQGVAVRLGQGP